MKKLLLICAALVGLIIPAKADVTLTFGALSTLVSQSASDPCIICATQQAHNPPNFGFNNFINTGQTDAGTFFSTNLVGGSLASGVEVGALPYTVGQLSGVFNGQLSFGVAIDVNSAEGKPPMTLDSFTLFRVDINDNNIETLAHYNTPTLMPDIQQGNGFADYLLSGFNLTGLQPGDLLIFRAQFHGGTDGGESFYLVPTSVQPVPELSTWLMMLLGFAGVGLVGMRKQYGNGFRFI